MFDRAKLRNELLRDEGIRLKSYQDTNGFWTIGVGHLLGASQRMTDINEQECDALLESDINLAEQVARNTTVPTLFDTLTDTRQRAIINMAFNRGERHMRESKTIVPTIVAAMAAPSPLAWEVVRNAILASPWAKQIGPRADRIADMLATG